MKKILLLCSLLTLLLGCGNAASNAITSPKLTITIGEKATSLDVRSSGIYKTMISYGNVDGEAQHATSVTLVMANFDLDTTSRSSLENPLTSEDQIRLTMQLVGEQGTDQNGELKPGVYTTKKDDKFMKVSKLDVSTFVGGVVSNLSFDSSGAESKVTGQVELKSVTAEAIAGVIDVTDGDRTVKGDFTAKLAKKNQ